MVTLSKTYKEPPFCEDEIRRYAGCREADYDVTALMRDCIREVQDKLSYTVCYGELPLTVDGDCCDFGAFSVRSDRLAEHLNGCRKVVLFAATVGVEIDRLIVRYGRISPSRAVMLQAIGAERIEALCDVFCDDLAKEIALPVRPRFSPGYGDLPLGIQRDIFAVLDCTKRIGLSLNDSLLMSPSKSVTAFVGFGDGGGGCEKMRCSACNKQDCAYRGAL